MSLWIMSTHTLLLYDLGDKSLLPFFDALYSESMFGWSLFCETVVSLPGLLQCLTICSLLFSGGWDCLLAIFFL